LPQHCRAGERMLASTDTIDDGVVVPRDR